MSEDKPSEPRIPIVDRLRRYDLCHDGDIDEAADMLAFIFDLMQDHSPKIDGTCYWRFSGGWPMSHASGRTPEEAIRAAMDEVNCAANRRHTHPRASS